MTLVRYLGVYSRAVVSRWRACSHRGDHTASAELGVTCPGQGCTVMFEDLETRRIDCGTPKDLPDDGWAIVVMSGAVEDTAESLGKIREVMRAICIKSESSWPEDSEWRTLLPEWFIGSFPVSEQGELEDEPLNWDFGSWMYSMEERVWGWWGSEVVDGQWRITLGVYEWPYSIEALLHLCRVAGAPGTYTNEPV